MLSPFQSYLQSLSDVEDLLPPRFHAAIEEILQITSVLAFQEPSMSHNDYVSLAAATKRLRGVLSGKV